jgi:hypothetical protein
VAKQDSREVKMPAAGKNRIKRGGYPAGYSDNLMVILII